MSKDKFDGSGREPRPSQKVALKWLDENKDIETRVIIAPTAAGKSGILRAQQLKTKGVILTPENTLADQYEIDYPGTLILKGSAHYECEKDSTITCQEMKELSEAKKLCEECPYKSAMMRALSGEVAVSNPMMFRFIYYQMQEVLQPKLFMVDEAHRLPGFLSAITQIKLPLPVDLFRIKPGPVSSEQALKILETYSKHFHKRMHQALQMKNLTKAADAQRKLERLTRVSGVLLSPDRNKMVTYVEQGKSGPVLHATPFLLPNSVREIYLPKKTQKIFVTATISYATIKELAPEGRVKILELDSTIPVANRRVMIAPRFQSPTKTPPENVALWIKHMMRRHKNPNTIVHVTYEYASRLMKFLPEGTLTHKPETKSETLRKFQAEGGLWVAPGCSEGVDLKYDQCRLNLIPFIPFANSHAPEILALLKLEDGEERYNGKTLETLIQMCGRSTRAENDQSFIYIGDARARWFFKKVEKQIPGYFKKSIS